MVSQVPFFEYPSVFSVRNKGLHDFHETIRLRGVEVKVHVLHVLDGELASFEKPLPDPLRPVYSHGKVDGSGGAEIVQVLVRRCDDAVLGVVLRGQTIFISKAL